ncbi:MAG TPA: DUF4139 domain-containing protein [Polyangiaceae bacterium]|nr:DUF4139 domain-containing protein [Polyangiaceae bacterium]
MKSRWLKRLSALGLAGLGLSALAGPLAPNAVAAPTPGPTAAAPAPAARVSEASDRKAVSITVYNSDFGLVREVRDIKGLPGGRVALEFRDVASTIQPQTVAVKSLGNPSSLSVLEQNYRFDLLTPETLLEKFVGRNVRTYRYHEATGKEEAADAKLLSVVNGPILQFGNEITFNYPGRLAFSEVPPNLIAKPTLVWLVESRTPDQSLEVTYLAQSMSWNADYVLVLDDKETTANLVGWVTLTNNTGTSYRNASLKLVAGDVNRVQPDVYTNGRMKAMPMAAAARAPAFQEEGLLEYHLYTLERPTDVLDKEQKQVTLLEAAGVGVQKKLIFYGQQYWFQGRYGELVKNQKVSVYLDFQNSEQNHLGMPLPKGTVRTYKADKSGAKQFIGEDAIDHTPRDERVRIKAGEAFDVVADRKQMSWTSLGDCSAESSWQIEVRNHKDEDIHVEVREPAGGDWTVTKSSHPAQKEDNNNFFFDVPVAKRGKTQLTYSIRVKWC